MSKQRLMTVLFWVFASIMVFGMILSETNPGVAVTTFGVLGLLFTAGMFLTWLRDGNENQ